MTSEKVIANLSARFALLGYELHTVIKAGRVHYEVRQSGQTRTCSTLHDLEGFLATLPITDACYHRDQSGPVLNVWQMLAFVGGALDEHRCD